MKVKELIAELQKHNPEFNVEISDGWEFLFYHTNGIKIVSHHGGIVDIGIGGCKRDDSK